MLNRFGTSIFVRMMFLSGKAKRSELIPRPDMSGLAQQPWISGNKCKPLAMPCRSFFCEWDKTTICGKGAVDDHGTRDGRRRSADHHDATDASALTFRPRDLATSQTRARLAEA